MQPIPIQVLVVHRHHELAPRIQRYLGPLAHVDLAFSPQESAPASSAPDAAVVPDVILLDLTVHVPEGFEVYRLIQSRVAAVPPVLMLRATSEAAGGDRTLRAGDGIEAVESGLQAALGRTPHRLALRSLRFSGAHLVADLPNTDVIVDGQRVQLSARETEVLAILLAHCNRVVPRSVLFAEVWGYETRSLDVHIRRLRSKLGIAGAQLETMVGLGYRFVERDEDSRPAGRGPGTPGPDVTTLDHKPRRPSAHTHRRDATT